MSYLRGTGVALYNLTLSKASGVQQAIYGNFSAPRQQELVVSHGKLLQLVRPNNKGSLQVVCSSEVFGQIRSLSSFRLPGAGTDYIVVGSDSGRIVILEYSDAKRSFVKVHQETFGRSGCRRIVPGQYIACDPAGRAVMVAATEKQKFVYVLNRDSANKLTISSPLEAHKSRHLVYSLAALDNGFENPIFAAIELDYTDADQDPTGDAAAEAEKHLVYYELDLGLNHVSRKWSKPADNGANMLIPVPGDSLKQSKDDQPGPGGVLVCAENFVIYMNEGHEDVRTVIPRRSNLPGDRQCLLVCCATHKMRNQFFVLAQSEYGDIYKITMVYQGPTVTELKVKYFDTIPVCTSICVLKTGFLFAASECGNHSFYEFQGVGDDEDSVEATSAGLMETEEGYPPVFFDPRPLRNLAPIDDVPSLCPMTDMKVANLLGEEVPQMFAACGRGARSTLRMLRPGLSVTEMAVTDLPAQPTAVWTVKASQAAEHVDLIVISFGDDKATLVLRVGETVQEVNDSGFEGKTATLAVQLLAENSILQVHQNGLRHIRTDKRINEWKTPGRRQILMAATNTHQVVIALSGSEIIYFELNSMMQLLEVEKKELSVDVACMAIAEVPEGRQRSQFLVVGCHDSTVRVLSLDPADCLKIKATQSLPVVPESILLLEASVTASEEAPLTGLFLHVGLANGVLIRTEVDPVTGRLTDQRTRFLGTRPPRLLPVSAGGARAMLALSSRPWLAYTNQGAYSLVPLSYDALDYVAPFSSEQAAEGFVAIARGRTTGTGTLRVLALERLGDPFNQQVMQLCFTPRKLLVDEEHGTLLLCEADHGAIPYAERPELQALADDGQENGNGNGAAPMGLQNGELSPEVATFEEQFGAPRGDVGQWASCLRVVSPKDGFKSALVLHMDNNEAALCMCLVEFAGRAAEGRMLAVGTAKGLQFYPRDAEEGYVRLYRFTNGGRGLELVHKTALNGVIPGALAPFQGRLLVGAGRSLRLMECGKKKLLRKCEYQELPNFVASIHTMGERIYIADAQESFLYMKYKKTENAFYVFADDCVPRYMSCALNIDYDTMAGGDKFGNIVMVRMPAEISLQVEDDPTGGKFASNSALLNAASNKVETIVSFHVGDLVTSLQKCTLQPGGQEVLVYGTISGGIGVLVPFTNAMDLDLFTQLEMHMRQAAPSLIGRDHLAYRSYFFPVKDVIDGDLCEMFSRLPASKQSNIGDETDRTPGELLKKLEDMRNKIL